MCIHSDSVHRSRRAWAWNTRTSGSQDNSEMPRTAPTDDADLCRHSAAESGGLWSFLRDREAVTRDDLVIRGYWHELNARRLSRRRPRSYRTALAQTDGALRVSEHLLGEQCPGSK
jgi:hypothetical protein